MKKQPLKTKEFKGLFTNQSPVSTVRVVTLLTTLTALYVGIFGVLTGKNLSSLAYLIFALNASVAGSKTVQKFAEVKMHLKPCTSRWWITHLLHDSGAVSSTRVCLFISAVGGITVSIMEVMKKHPDLEGAAYLAGAFLLPQGVTKGVSKFAELKEKFSNEKSME